MHPYLDPSAFSSLGLPEAGGAFLALSSTVPSPIPPSFSSWGVLWVCLGLLSHLTWTILSCRVKKPETYLVPKDSKNNSVTGERHGQSRVGHPVGSGNVIGDPERRLCRERSRGWGRAALKGLSGCTKEWGSLGGSLDVKLWGLMSVAALPSTTLVPTARGCRG